MQTTRQRIIEKARKLFSEFGIANTRLQQIADESTISVGNLAYHFSNKEEIVLAVYEEVLEELSGILVKSKIEPSLQSFEDKFSGLFDFMKNNVFYFTNFWEIKRNYSSIDEKIKNINARILSKLKKRINDNVKRGVIGKPAYSGAHNLLAKTLLISINNWLPQQLLNDKPLKENLFKTYLWNLLYPYLTAKGKKEFSLFSYFKR